MRYVRIDEGTVVNATIFNGSMPEDWDQPNMWVAHEDAQIGWAFEDGQFTPPPEPEPPPLTADQARAKLIDTIDRATSSILDAYPASERLGWDAKAAEAGAVLAAGDGATLTMAPLLTAECAAEYGPTDDAARLVQLVAKAATVHAKAVAWGQLMATLSGIRGRAFAQVDAAEDDAGRQVVVDAALMEIEAAT